MEWDYPDQRGFENAKEMAALEAKTAKETELRFASKPGEIQAIAHRHGARVAEDIENLIRALEQKP